MAIWIQRSSSARKGLPGGLKILASERNDDYAKFMSGRVSLKKGVKVRRKIGDHPCEKKKPLAKNAAEVLLRSRASTP